MVGCAARAKSQIADDDGNYRPQGRDCYGRFPGDRRRARRGLPQTRLCGGCELAHDYRLGRYPGVLTIAGDIADPATAEQLVTGAVERFGRVDTLINNAEVFIAKPFTHYTATDYALITAVNLTGFFHITQRVIAQMLAQGVR
jgi:NAD(P)-dependent dehydrogenase (short-subunit alcohol dehydrogenase family)